LLTNQARGAAAVARNVMLHSAKAQTESVTPRRKADFMFVSL
jgi:hypothetical protein